MFFTKKATLPIIFMVLGILAGYFSGYYNGVNKAILMEKVISSEAYIHTITYLKQNKPDKALGIQLDMLDTNICTIDDIDKNKYKLILFPKRLITYMDMLSLNLDSQKNSIRDKFKQLKEKVKG